MAGQDLVRPSRDGDQFHYHWAARQCLRLLPGTTDLVSVTIEGPSTGEGVNDPITEGEELIDVGLYYGAEGRDHARLIHYIQLKHSTRNASEGWTASGLQKTLKGFALRYKKLLERYTADDIASRFRFEFTSNRPIDNKVQEALADLASGAVARHPDEQKLIVKYSGLSRALRQQFFRLLSVTGGEGNLWAQRHLLAQDLSRYLVGADSETPLELKELVTRKATTEFESNPSIRRYDVLRALKASEEQLAPAPCLLPEPEASLPRDQETEILNILIAATTPVIIHADGGVGKSVLSARLAASMPFNSEAVLYDCFGDGLYRNALNFRHRHRDALVQIANELAARGLCHPLIPTPHADAKQYMRAFLGRLTQAVALLRARDQNATLCIIVDAADNAEMAAVEQGEPGSFVRDLIRAPLPSGIHVAFTCRTHRRSLLNAPPNSQQVELLAFSPAESVRHLRTRYPAASDIEAAEFAVLSASNPRVQALALSRSTSLVEMLKELGPEPTTVDRAIGNLLEAAISRLMDSTSGIEVQNIDLICQGLAVLRPLVPVTVLAKVSGTSEGAVRSFALDLGRPLILKGDSIHFLDEPTETWFRQRFGPEAKTLATFVDRLQPLTEKSAYSAAALPQLLLQIGRFDELVDLALSDKALPSENPLETRDVKLQRLRFALRACLQRGSYTAAGKLALKAGGECAGEERQNQVIKDHTDVASILMAPDRIEALVVRRAFGDSWQGSHYAYEAGLMSGCAEHVSDAASRLRMAKDWLSAWMRQSDEQREHGEDVSVQDIAEIAFAKFRLEGPTAAVRFLKIWRPRNNTFSAGRKVARRLVDLGQYDKLDELADASGRDTWLLLALCVEANLVGHVLPSPPMVRLMQVLQRPQVILPGIGWDEPWAILDAVRSAIEIALRCLPPQSEAWAEILRRYLPSDPPGSIFSRRGNEKFILLHAYALESALRGHRVDLDAIISDIRLQKSGGGRTYDTELFRSEAGGVLPWFSLSAEIACGRSPSDISNAIQSALGEATRANRHGYENLRIICPQVASELLRIICAVEDVPKGQLDSLKSWLSEHERHLPVDTLITLCRYAARRHGFEHLAMDFCVRAYSALDASREAADSQADSFVRLARAILTVSAEEARAYFNRAVEIANRIGDENIDRLFALLNLATAASEGGVPRPRTAYRLSRTAELKKRYVERDKHFPWDMTMEVLVDLCPTSALAILSRWRDRRFGPSERLLPIVVGRLVGKRLLPESTPIVFAGIDAYWERVLDLKRALAAENNPQTRARLARVAYRYIRVSPANTAFWASLKELSGLYNLDLPDIERLSRSASIDNRETKGTFLEQCADDASVASPRRPDWNVILQNANLCDASTLLSLYFELYKYDPPYDHEVFFREALSRVKPGRESDFIRAIATWPDFTYLNLRELLRALPSPIPNQLALRTAIKDLVLSTCRREPHRIQKVGWLDESLLEVLSLGGIIAHRDIATAALEGVSAQAEILDASKIFKSLGPIALLLSPAQADEVLDFGFSLLDEILKPEDGDGVWRESLQPHGTVVDALAGYIWVGLGSAVASERWQYAHVVRAIAELGWTELLTAVVAMADADCSEFTDQQLLFYGWHARQWLLIGITRTAIDNPTALGPAHAFLERSLKFDHIIIRDLAAQALRALTAAGEYHATTIGDLTVNHPKNTLVYSGFMKRNDEQTEPSTDAERNDSHHFWPDIGPYWFEPLGRAFGLNQKDIERRAMTVIRRELGWSGGFDWREDRRRARNLFDETETSHGHGSLPKTDDLLTYLAYHAMMHVSADLLEERPALRNVEDHITEFDDWMKQYMLTRSDGRWLADWRTPRIITTDSGSARYEKAWRWGVDARYLDQQLMTDDGMRVLWGQWQNGDSDRYETISIRSALVPVMSAQSLLATLQTAPRLDQFHLPYADEDISQADELSHDSCADSADVFDTDDDTETDEMPINLVGWLTHSTQETRLDAYDCWGEGVVFPGAAPSDTVVLKLGLRQRQNESVWEAPAGGLIRAEHWTQIVRSGRQEESVSGERFGVNPQFLRDLFHAYPSHALIVSVAIRRHSPDDSRDEQEFETTSQPYVRYYLIGGDNVITTL